MAGDWIKMRGNLWDDPRVSRLCDITDSGEAAVVGGLYWLWATADQHTEDGRMPGLTLRQIDRKTGIPGFGAALCAIGWLEDHPDGAVILSFEEHNGTSAKRRSVEAQRKANVRNVSASDADRTGATTGQIPPKDGAREEKRREEKKEETGEGSTSRKRAATRKCPTSFEVTVELETWAATDAPRADLTRETQKLRDYTFKNPIVDWVGAWKNWMRRASDDVRPHSGSAQTETSYQRSMRERVAEFAPSLARQAPNATNVIDMEIFDVPSIARN